MPIATVHVYGTSDPKRWAGFRTYDDFVEFLENQYNDGAQHDQNGPLEDPTYIIDPSLDTLMRSDEFRLKLSAKIKELILKDQKLIDAFASFLNAGGTIEITTAAGQYAQYFKELNGGAPRIEMPASFADPTDFYIGRSLLGVAHEIFHDMYYTLPNGVSTAEDWGRNEAYAMLEAFRATERIGVYITRDGLNLLAGEAVNIIRASPNDQAALENLTRFYADNAPSNYPRPPAP